VGGLVRPTTRAIYVETLTNPLLELGDLLSVAAFARERKLVSIIDNTFASPVNFRPIDRGFDLSIHSCTKYLNGHSDLVAGAVIGRAELVEAACLPRNGPRFRGVPGAGWDDIPERHLLPKDVERS
jgi:cystathionine beta-lyase/cystathionine gamma-synthase